MGFSRFSVGLESGSLSSYLTKGLQALECKAICIDARKMSAILSVTVNKTDKNDGVPRRPPFYSISPLN